MIEDLGMDSVNDIRRKVAEAKRERDKGNVTQGVTSKTRLIDEFMGKPMTAQTLEQAAKKVKQRYENNHPWIPSMPIAKITEEIKPQQEKKKKAKCSMCGCVDFYEGPSGGGGTDVLCGHCLREYHYDTFSISSTGQEIDLDRLSIFVDPFKVRRTKAIAYRRIYKNSSIWQRIKYSLKGVFKK